MMRATAQTLSPLLLALAAACDGAAPAADPPQPPPPAIDPATAGAIKGLAVFEGTPPPNARLAIAGNPECNTLHATPPLDEVVLVRNGRLRNAFVYVKDGLGAHAFPWPTEPVTVANRKCVYVPRVVGAQVHQPIRFVNDDPTDHNVHGFTASGQFNFTLRGKDASQVQKLRHPEVVVRVKCDLHPWMIGYVGVVPHPFFAVTGDDGAFELKGLPPGDYVLEAWHEKLGTRTASVKLGAGGTAEATFRFSP